MAFMAHPLLFMTNFAIVGTIGMTIEAVFTDAADMGVLIGANFAVFGVVMTLAAAHGHIGRFFRIVSVMAFGAIQLGAVGGGMEGVIKHHRAAIGLKGDFLRRLWPGKVLRVMAKGAVHGAGDVAGGALLTDAVFVQGFILTNFSEFFIIIMTIPARGGLAAFTVIIIIMMTLAAFGVFKTGMFLMIENNSAATGCESDPWRRTGLLHGITHDGNHHEQYNQRGGIP